MPPTITEQLQTAAQLHTAGDLTGAENLYLAILQLSPNDPDALHLLGVIRSQQLRFDEARQLIERAISIKPDPGFYFNLASNYEDQQQWGDAAAAFAQAAQLNPQWLAAHWRQGKALANLRKPADAAVAYERALKLEPQNPDVLNDYGCLASDFGRCGEAADILRHVVTLRPNFPQAHLNLALAVRRLACVDEAVTHMRTALSLDPDRSSLHATLLYELQFQSHDPAEIAAEHHRWATKFAEPLTAKSRPHPNDPNPNRPLRIGYIGPTFRNNVVGRNFLPVLEHHDRQQFQIFLYSNTPANLHDPTTTHMQSLATAWRDVVNLPDAKIEDLIRADTIDILVDLNGHMSNARMLLMAAKPAPVQVTHMGYPASMGTAAINYRITDPHLDSPDDNPAFSTETPAPLPHCWWCFRPSPITPPLNDLPALHNGFVTFGSLNNIVKMTPATLDLWCQVLVANPTSKLLIPTHLDPITKQTIANHFIQRGIPADRLILANQASHSEFLKLYHQLDIGLDTIPYNGHSTSCESLWMGVPVITLPGKTTVSRAGASLLHNIALPEFIANSPAAFVRIATELAADLPRLAHLRSTLRHRMQNSPLMDEVNYTRSLETLYRHMWQRWCAQSNQL